MAILKRSKKSILGLDIELSSLTTNVNNNASNIAAEITRATGVENTLSSNLTAVSSQVSILNADSSTTGSVDKKIADALISTPSSNDVYTKAEVDSIASTKVDTSLVLSTLSTSNKVVTQTELATKANSADVYTQSQIDTSLAAKADVSTTYTKTDVDTALANKANTTDVYTKTETDNLVSPKANSADVYTKTEVDTALTTKLNTSDTITAVSGTNKIATQTELANKANTSDVYSKSEIDTQLSSVIVDSDTLSTVTSTNKVVTEAELTTKANSADVYTQTQIDTSLANKADLSLAGKVGPSLKTIDETNIADGTVLSYNATSGNLEYAAVTSSSASTSIDDNATALDTTWSSTKISNELSTKANSADVYTQGEVDSKISVSSYGIKYSVADTTALNNLTGMAENELAVNNGDRKVYKYDGTTWNVFYALDGVHNHDDLYYSKADVDTFLAGKEDTGTSYTKTEEDNLLAGKADITTAGKVGPSFITVDETNKADGTVLGFNASTGNIEYVAKSGSATIDDNTSSTSTTYSSNKIDSELALKANSADTYTKAEVDTAVNSKVNTSDVLTATSTSNKIVTETELALKANSADTYTKAEVDTAVNSKVNTSDVLTAISDTNKVVTQTDIAGKADSSNVYTKSEVDTSLANKANSADVYTQSQIDTSLASKLNTTDTLSAVTDTNKIVTETELANKVDTASVYTKSEVDGFIAPLFDDTNALSAVTASNKLVTETELATKVNVSDVKSTIAVDNKVVTETDVSQAIAAYDATAATAPIIVVDRPTMSTKSSSGLDYVFQFPLSKPPHGLVAVNDEITIYNFDVNGDATIFENVSLFADKHGEIAVTLATTDDESKYNGKTIKVCYLTTEITVTPGTDALHPIIIDAGCDFEAQGAGTTSYAIDFSAGDFYRVIFTDGYYTNINHDVTHTDFNVNNTTDYEANNFDATDAKRSTNWDGIAADEVEYTTYNWSMDLSFTSGTTYTLTFERLAAVGGGAL